MTDYRWLYISSTIVKEVAAHGADIGAMVPPATARALAEKFRKV
jgi:pantetheine-phosphate adenylyltransferase